MRKIIITIVNQAQSNSVLNHSSIVETDKESFELQQKYLSGFRQLNTSSCGVMDSNDPTYAAIFVKGDEIATLICVKSY